VTTLPHYPVGRPSPLGNPFPAVKGNPGATIPRYRAWLWTEIQSGGPALAYLREIANAEREFVLVCPGCRPNSATCHARVIEKAVDWMRLLPKEAF